MLTLKVHDSLVTWPDDFAEMMIRQYRALGIPYMVCNNLVAPEGNRSLLWRIVGLARPSVRTAP